MENIINFDYLKREQVAEILLNDSELNMINNILKVQQIEQYDLFGNLKDDFKGVNLVYLSTNISWWNNRFDDAEKTLNNLIENGYISLNNIYVNLNQSKLLNDINQEIEIKTNYKILADELGLDFIDTIKLNDMLKYEIKCEDRSGGVYLIDNFYIGKSKNIFGRSKEHIKTLLGALINGTKLSKPQLIMLNKMLNNQDMKCEAISKIETAKEETKMINKYLSEGYPLTNTTGVKKELKLTEEKLISIINLEV